MKNRSKLLIIGATSVAIAAGGTSFALAGGGGDDGAGDSEAPIPASALDQASAAALNEVDGTVTETEVGDEESYYEVEVTLDDGSEVDVQVNRDFDVVGSEAEGADEEESGDDD